MLLYNTENGVTKGGFCSEEGILENRHQGNHLSILDKSLAYQTCGKKCSPCRLSDRKTRPQKDDSPKYYQELQRNRYASQ